MRKLKFAEHKLLKHADFIDWKVDNNLHAMNIMRKFHIQKREDYVFYLRMARQLRSVATQIKDLDPKDPARVEFGGELLEKLYALGLIPTKWNLKVIENLSASAFCRRRLPCIMIKNGMAPYLKMAVTFIEQGHVRVGEDVIKDPAFIVSRNLEDYVTWVPSSKIRKHILQYNEEKDDFILENC